MGRRKPLKHPTLPPREQCISLVRAGTQPPSREHTRIRRCFKCNRDVYTRPLQLTIAREISRRVVYVCPDCADKKETYDEFNRRFLGPG
jgi:hypothetical protein